MTSYTELGLPVVQLVTLEVVAAKRWIEKTGVIQLSKGYALPTLPTLENCKTSPSDIRKWSHLKELRLPQVDKTGNSILIGQDVSEALWPLELRKGKEGQAYATRTRFGWSLNGPLESEFLAGQSAFCLETSEALANSLPHFSVDDRRAVGVWQWSVEAVDGHYQMNRSVAETPLQ